MNRIFILALEHGPCAPTRLVVSAPTLAEAQRLAQKHTNWPGEPKRRSSEFKDITAESLKTAEVIIEHDRRD